MTDFAPHHTIDQAAQEHAAPFPPLLAKAEKLAASIATGSHGRRQAGTGEEFWQYRNAIPGDEWHSIDWRRSARSDAYYIRQREWQAAQSVFFWIDRAMSMGFSGDKSRPDKGTRAALIGLATAILLVRAGERIGMAEDIDPPKSGRIRINRMLTQILNHTESADYGQPPERTFPHGSRAVFLSDFLGDWAAVGNNLAKAADHGVSGALVQVLDPVEEVFPFDGRTEFHSMSGAVRFETLRARALKSAYLEKLAERKDALREICARTGWQYMCHHTSDSARSALIWLYAALEQGR